MMKSDKISPLLKSKMTSKRSSLSPKHHPQRYTSPQHTISTQSRRFHIVVHRPSKKDGEFADEKPYWEAAALVPMAAALAPTTQTTTTGTGSTQEGPHTREDGMETIVVTKKKLRKSRHLQKVEQQNKRKKVQLIALKKQYEKEMARMKSPDFNMFATPNQTRIYSDGSNQNDNDMNGQFMRNIGKLGVTPTSLSPSDMSPVSTIPPTPTSQSNKLAMFANDDTPQTTSHEKDYFHTDTYAGDEELDQKV